MRAMRRWWVVVAMLVLVGGWAQRTLAAAAATSVASGAEPEAVVETEADAAYQIGSRLRCPVCQGMPIAESPSRMAQDMMARIRQLLAEGKSPPEVLRYFETRYGEWVLLQPKAQGFNWLVWLLPPLGLLLGGWLTWSWVGRLSQPPVSNHQATETASMPVKSSLASSSSSSSDDPYLQAIRQEVEQ